MTWVRGARRHGLQAAARWQAMAAGLLACGVVPALAAAHCNAPAASAQTGVESSRWEEHNAQGQRLVRERGTLRQHRLVGHLRCADADWTLAWTLSQGARAYDGQTNTGTPVLSSSGLRAQELQWGVWWPVDGAWALGAQLDWSQTRRELRSTATALGFPERFQHWRTGLGARFQHPVGDRLIVSASGWVGGGPGGDVRVEFPGYAPVNLPLGNSRFSALGLELSAPHMLDTRDWRWSSALVYQRQVFRAGDARVLFKAGQPVGTAWQPASLLQHLRWTVGVHRDF